MGTTEPIRDTKKLEEFRNYYKEVEPNARNYLMVVTGLNTALRISDILSLRWQDVYDFEHKKVSDHITLCEQKTGKPQVVATNKSLRAAVKMAMKEHPDHEPGDYIFKGYGDGHLNRSTAYRIIRRAAISVGLSENISCHSMRKTFGYYAWKKGCPPILLMNVYNHSSFQITKRYLGIDQDDKDKVFLKNNL